MYCAATCSPQSSALGLFMAASQELFNLEGIKARLGGVIEPSCSELALAKCARGARGARHHASAARHRSTPPRHHATTPPRRHAIMPLRHRDTPQRHHALNASSSDERSAHYTARRCFIYAMLQPKPALVSAMAPLLHHLDKVRGVRCGPNASRTTKIRCVLCGMPPTPLAPLR
jgi:hypothetical protein